MEFELPPSSVNFPTWQLLVNRNCYPDSDVSFRFHNTNGRNKVRVGRKIWSKIKLPKNAKFLQCSQLRHTRHLLGRLGYPSVAFCPT